MIAVPDYPRLHRISAQEYVRMAEAGVFHPEARLELMDGAIVEMAPIGCLHAAVVNSLTELVVHLAAKRAIVSIQNPVIVGSHSVPQPDLLLLKPRADRYSRAHPTASDVLLVVEVADSSLRSDRDQKIPMYGRAGIAEAWLIDVEQRVLHVFTSPDPSGGYREQTTAAPGRTVRITALPAVEFDVGELFPGS